MNNNINKIFLLGLSFFSLSLGSCVGEFEKWNTNPNEATQEMMQADNLSIGAFFVQMEKNVNPIAQEGVCGDDAYQICNCLMGDSYAGYMTSLLTKPGTPNYKMISEWCDVPFTRAFVGIMTPWKAIKDKVADTDPIAFSMANIIKVAGMQRITDMYGPIPYVNFGKGASYSSQEEVYHSFFKELEQAVTVLTDYCGTRPNAKYLAEYDNVFNGNILNWIKYANTLRLRLAIRVAYVDPVMAKLEGEKAVSHPLGLISEKADVVALQHKRIAFNHPLYVIYGQFDDVRMGAVMESYLNGFKDPRLSAYFTPNSDGSFKGVRNGIYFYNKDLYSKGPFSGINIESSSPVVWMSPSESFFLKAEGALRGWNMGGSAKDFYEKGIAASFDYCNLSNKTESYLSSVSTPISYVDPISSSNNVEASSTLCVKWSDSDSFERKLEKIVTQKWIAIYPDGQEAWTEFRRTGYPKVFPVVRNLSNEISTSNQIRRIPFSSTERLSNPNEIIEAEKLLGGPDNGNTKLWWDKK